MTGAPVPDGFDTVVRVEDTRVEDGIVVIERCPEAGANVRLAGEDFKKGAAAVSSGTLLGPEHVLVLSSLGFAEVKVRPKPRVAVLSTGAELVTPANPPLALAPGQIYNSTGPFLLSALDAWGAQTSYHGVVGDKPSDFLRVLERILDHKPDVVITTGAVSMGKHDFVLSALADLKARTVFHKVKIRPGKPILFSELAGGLPFFGLPGNPISTAIGLRFFVEPFLRRLTGRPPERPFRAVLADRYSKPEGWRCFLKARLSVSGGRVIVLPGESSALVAPLLEANAWAILSEGATGEPGDEVEALPLHSLPFEGDRGL